MLNNYLNWSIQVPQRHLTLILFFFFSWPKKTWILCICHGSHALWIFHIRHCAKLLDHVLNHVLTFQFEKESLQYLCSSYCHFFRMLGSIGGSNLNPSCLFLDVKGYYIPLSFITSLRYTECKVNSKTLSQTYRIQVLVSDVGDFPFSELGQQTVDMRKPLTLITFRHYGNGMYLMLRFNISS